MAEENDQPSGVREMRQERQALADLGAALPGTGLAGYAEQFGEATDWPADLRDAPVILDTDIGGDPDDALAVAAAARTLPQFALLLTADETGPRFGRGQRARFARWLLDALGRGDVAVAEGLAVGDTPYYCVEDLTPDAMERQPNDVVAAVRVVCAATDGPVRWVGMGPVGNLAQVIEQAPELARRLRVTQMGGALDYRHPDRAEHNIRLNVPAAHRVLAAIAARALPAAELVTSDVTWTPQIAVNAQSPLYRALAVPDAPLWATILLQHLHRWFERFHPDTLQHDALTLSAAMELPFVLSADARVQMDEIGRLSRAEDGVPLRLSVSARYQPFMQWLTRTLDPAASTTTAAR
jgi:inosine-uridine nucleoside N-ribohydrolase